jgi:outer membrane lipoprotein
MYCSKPFWLLSVAIVLLSGCIHPISKEVREQSSSKTCLCEISEDPDAYIGERVLLGGTVVALEHNETDSTLELLEWQLNRWGEPVAMKDKELRFLVNTQSLPDKDLYEPGVLVTLAGTVTGSESRRLGSHYYRYPVLDLTEIHRWETPFRYGIHRQPGPDSPTHVYSGETYDRHPYDPSYSVYPYTPYLYRFWW